MLYRLVLKQSDLECVLETLAVQLDSVDLSIRNASLQLSPCFGGSQASPDRNRTVEQETAITVERDHDAERPPGPQAEGPSRTTVTGDPPPRRLSGR